MGKEEIEISEEDLFRQRYRFFLPGAGREEDLDYELYQEFQEEVSKIGPKVLHDLLWALETAQFGRARALAVLETFAPVTASVVTSVNATYTYARIKALRRWLKLYYSSFF